MLGHGAQRPVRPVGRGGLQGGVDDLGHPFIVVAARAPGTQFVVQAFQSLLKVAFAPFGDGVFIQPQPCRDGAAGFAFGTGEDNLGALDQSVGQAA